MKNEVGDQYHIHETIHRFANSFDIKDWTALEDCFLREIYTDYSDLRGSPPERMKASQFVLLRQTALKDLRTQHLCGNHEVDIDGERASCKTTMLIFRLNEATREYFTTHAYYRFDLQKVSGSWKIAGITQKVFWNEGNPQVHPGILETKA